MATQTAGCRRQAPASKQWPATRLGGGLRRSCPHQIGKFEAEVQVQAQDKAGNEFQIPYLHQKFAHIQYKLLNRSKHNSNGEWKCDDRMLDLFVDPDGV